LAGRSEGPADEHESSSLPGDKPAIRRWTKAFRRALTEADIEERSRRILAGVYALPEFAAAHGILTCLSFGNEPDTWPLVRDASHAKRLYVPRADIVTGELSVHPYPVELRRSRLGILEPVPGCAQLSEDEVDAQVDLILVPGLAFGASDRTRLGYGAGFFDRFLRRHPIPAVGLGYDETLVPSLPCDPHDVPMALIVTDRRVLRGPPPEGRRCAP